MRGYSTDDFVGTIRAGRRTNARCRHCVVVYRRRRQIFRRCPAALDSYWFYIVQLLAFSPLGIAAGIIYLETRTAPRTQNTRAAFVRQLTVRPVLVAMLFAHAKCRKIWRCQALCPPPQRRSHWRRQHCGLQPSKGRAAIVFVYLYMKYIL